jgi:hypothetical protein
LEIDKIRKLVAVALEVTTISNSNRHLAQIAAASFFVAASASLRQQQKRYSGKLEIASKKGCERFEDRGLMIENRFFLRQNDIFNCSAFLS